MNLAARMVFIALAIIAIGFVGLLGPQLMAIADVRESLGVLKSEYAWKANRAINLDLYRLQLKESDNTFGQLLRALPNRIDRSFEGVFAAGRKSGLRFDVLQAASEAKSLYYVELPVHLETTGRFHQLGAFIADLSLLSPIVRIDSLDIRRSSTPGRVLLKADLRLFRYLDEDPSAAPKAKPEPWRLGPEWKFARQDATFGSGLWLVCCSAEQDLKRDLEALRRDQRGKVQPFPAGASQRHLRYDVGGMPDVFYPADK